MKNFALEIFAVTNLFCIGICLGENELARGWNENINWVKLEEGEKLAQTSKQPMMLVIHKSWCGACKALKPQFALSKQIEELSTNFVMVNTLDDEEPKDPKFAPDGGYIPRILFRDPEGNILSDIFNIQGSDKYKYYYSDPVQIVAAMERCIEKMKSAPPSESGEL